MKKTLLALIALGLALANASATTYSDTETSTSGLWNIQLNKGEVLYDAYADLAFTGSGGDVWIAGSKYSIYSSGRINLFSSALLDLQDGTLRYDSTLQSLTAKLTARAGTSNGVPDGGATLLLLGLAFFVILGVQRWKFASAS